MGELVAFRSLQMLDYLANNNKFQTELVQDEVNKLVLALRKIEKLLNNDRNNNSRKVLDNMEKIRNLAYLIEDGLENWTVLVELACMPSNNDKRRGLLRILRCFGREDDDSVIFFLATIHLMKSFFLGESSIMWLHDTFPEDVWESEHIKGIRRMGNLRSLRWPRQMNVHGMEEHFVEMKEDSNKLVSLVAEDKEHPVVSIWGVKGLGKTTMARKVYIHPQVRSRFNAFAWVSLDKDYEIGSLIQNMFNQLDAGGVKKSAEEQKKHAEDYQRNHLRNIKKVKGEEEKKEGGREQEKKKGDAWQKEGLEEQRNGDAKMKEDAVEKIEGVVEKKKDIKEEKEHAVEKKKEHAVEKKKGTEKQKEGANEKMKEDSKEKKEGIDKTKNGAEEKMKEGAEEKEKGAEEQIRGAEEKKGAKNLKIGDILQNMMKQGAGVVKKSTEELNEGAASQKESAEKKDKYDGAKEKAKGDEEKKNGVEEQKKVAEKKEKAAEVQKKGSEEKKVGAEERKKGLKESIKWILFLNMMKAPMKKSLEEHNQDAEEQQKSMEVKMLAELKDILKQKSCLIVIDGILEPSQWMEISSKIVMEDTDTKFLITTADEETAGVGYAYELRSLNEDEGWELLQKYAFHGETAPDLGLMPKLGKEMVHKCGYLPSKISSLGRTLSAMPFNDWHKVNDNVTGYLSKDNQSECNERMCDVVDPSYDHLPYCQKQCFLYLAIFKEDEDLDPEDLSFLWIGEGMVSPQKLEKDKERTILDATEYYLRELAFRGMLHVQIDELSARFMPFSLHNRARELSLYLGDKEDFRLKVVDFSGGKEPRFDPYTLSDGTRRLVIHFNKLSSRGERNLNASWDLRSLLFLNSDREYICLPVRISDFHELTLLRVLHFVRCKFEGRKLPEGIWKLLNLRYLGLLYCDLDKLPPSISNLRNLHVLNIRSYHDGRITIPNTLSEMVQLKHVRLPHNSNREQQSDKLKFDGLVDLETLVGFNVDEHDVDSLSKLKNLEYLGTHVSSNDSLRSFIDKFSKFGKSDRIRTSILIEYKCNFTSPEGLTILEELLMCPNLDALTFSMVLIHKLPNCGTYSSQDVTQIKLIGCKLSEDPMEALGKFPNLRKLCLGYGAFVGRKMAIHDKGFPKLEYLEFRCLPNLEEWIVDEGALRNLSTVTLKWCPKLKSLPQELTNVSSLKNLELEFDASALNENWEEKYKQMFAFLKSCTIRKRDPLSAGSSSAHAH